MRLRDLIPLRKGPTMSGNSARPERPRGAVRNGIEPLEGRQLLSGLASSELPLPPSEVASWSTNSGTQVSREGDRPAVIEEFNSATQDGPPASILYLSEAIESSLPFVSLRSEEFAVGVATSVPSPGEVKPMDATSPGGPGMVARLTTISLLEGKAIGLTFSDDWTTARSAHASLMVGMIFPPPFYGPSGDPTPFAGQFHTDPANWISSRFELVDLLFVADDPTFSVEATNEEVASAWDAEDSSIGPVISPGTGRELSNQSGVKFPEPLGSPRLQGRVEESRPPDVSTRAKPDAIEALDGESVTDEVESVDEATECEETTMSRGADLFASFSPFDRVALEHAIDQFLGQIVDLNVVLSHLEVTASLLPHLMAAAGAIGVLEVVRRRVLGPAGEQGESPPTEGDASCPGLPVLPRGWALEEL